MSERNATGKQSLQVPTPPTEERESGRPCAYDLTAVARKRRGEERDRLRAEVGRARHDFYRRVERELYDDPEFAHVSTNAVNGLLNRLLAWTDATKGETLG